MFSFSNLFSSLLVAGTILAAEAWQKQHRPSLDLSPARVAVRFEPVVIGAIAAPARVAGAWAVSAGDNRFGGISGLGIDQGKLLALSDGGMLMAIDRPGTKQPTVTIRALPAVPGPATRKIGRDSEALLRDPAGRGWWVAFEQVHSLWLYDRGFTRTLKVIPVENADFSDNHGIETLADDHGRVRWLAESTGASDAARLPDGAIMLLERRIGVGGVSSWLKWGGQRLALPLARSDNPEALTAEPLPNGGTRLWIMTDNDLKPWRRTLLVAIDLPPAH